VVGTVGMDGWEGKGKKKRMKKEKKRKEKEKLQLLHNCQLRVLEVLGVKFQLLLSSVNVFYWSADF